MNIHLFAVGVPHLDSGSGTPMTARLDTRATGPHHQRRSTAFAFHADGWPDFAHNIGEAPGNTEGFGEPGNTEGFGEPGNNTEGLGEPGSNRGGVRYPVTPVPILASFAANFAAARKGGGALSFAGR